MAEPPYNSCTSQSYAILGEDAPRPEVTDPRTVTLYFKGFHTTSGVPGFHFVDDTGVMYLLPFVIEPDPFPSSEPFVPPYVQDGQIAPASDIELEPSNEIVRFIRGIQLGKLSAGTRNVKWYTGASGGACTFQPPGPNDGSNILYQLPQVFCTAAGQSLQIQSTTSTDAVTQWGYMGLSAHTPPVNITIPANFCAYVVDHFTIASGKVLTIESGATFKVG